MTGRRHQAGTRRRVRVSVAALVVLLVLGAVATAWVRELVQDQEERLLRERGTAAALVLSSAVANVSAQLAQLGTAAQVSDVAPSAFTEVAAAHRAATPTIRVEALLRPAATGYAVAVSEGPALAPGQAIDGPRLAAVEQAARGRNLVTTSLFRDGPGLALGYAIGPPTAPAGTILYRESTVAPGTPTRTTSSAPFAELKAELYATNWRDPAQVVLATSDRPGPDDRTYEQIVNVGDSEWLLVLAARHPLAGPLPARLPWLVAGATLLGSVLIAAMVESLARRRNYALALVERRTVELRESLASLEVARREADEARDQAMDASRMKSEFLANMSHEIRTPLNGVIGMTGLLLDTPLNTEQREFAEIARRAGASLLEIINDVLDFSKIEAGKLELEVSTIHPDQVVEDVSDLFAPVAQAKGVELTASTAADLPRSVVGDPGRVQQVLTNLVGNAVKFTAAGEVAIRASAERGERGPVVRFSVRDTGIGIDRAQQRRLFEAFTQADSSTTREYGGTGLGLTISRRLTEMMGGTIGVDSTPGVGSTFWFEVPLEAASEGARAAVDDHATSVVATAPGRLHPGAGGSTETGAWKAPPGLRALVAEDNAVNQRVVAAMLDRLGFRIDVVGDGEGAVAAVLDRHYDVVLMDCHMPRMNGYDAAGEIRRREPGHTPIVALTASALKGDEERCLAAGMDAYVAKPVRMEDLTGILAQVLDDVARSPGDLPAGGAARTSTVLDPVTVAGIRAIGEDVLATVTSDFRSGAPNDIARLKRGLVESDALVVEEAAHRLRGGCLVLGALRMAEVATQIESQAVDGRLDQAASLLPVLQQSYDDLLVALDSPA